MDKKTLTDTLRRTLTISYHGIINVRLTIITDVSCHIVFIEIIIIIIIMHKHNARIQ